MWTGPIDAYRQIRGELEAYSPKLAAKPEYLAANKMDLAGASEALADLRSALPGKQIFAISAVAGTGLRPLLEELWQRVDKLPVGSPLVAERPYVPPVVEAVRSDSEMFKYVEAEADEGAWEGDEDSPDVPIAEATDADARRGGKKKGMRAGLINAAGR